MTETEKQDHRSRIFVNIRELSSKQRKAMLGLIKDMGFTEEEVGEIIVEIGDSGAASPGEPSIGGPERDGD